MLSVFIVSVICASIWLWLLTRYEQQRSRSVYFLLWTGLMGGALSVELAWIFNTIVSDLTGISFDTISNQPTGHILFYALSIGFNEELLKLLAACLILKGCREQLRHPLDIMLLGLSVSLGFSLWENIMYGHLFSWGIVILRSLIPGHIVYGAIWSYGLKELYRLKNGRDAKEVFGLCCVLSILIHGAYDFLVFLDTGWALIAGIVLDWIPVFVFHLILRDLAISKQNQTEFLSRSKIGLNPVNTSRKKIVNSVPTRKLIRLGKRPIITSKSIYISEDTESMLNALCYNRYQKTGICFTSNAFLCLAIQKLHQKQQTQVDFASTYKIMNSNRRAIDQSPGQTIRLSYSTLVKLDELRRSIKTKGSAPLPRHIYLRGFVGMLYQHYCT